jgi:hypothetical protein
VFWTSSRYQESKIYPKEDLIPGKTLRFWSRIGGEERVGKTFLSKDSEGHIEQAFRISGLRMLPRGVVVLAVENTRHGMSISTFRCDSDENLVKVKDLSATKMLKPKIVVLPSMFIISSMSENVWNWRAYTFRSENSTV